MSKRILYIGENALSTVQGGGIVAYSLLKSAEPSDILGIYNYPTITPAREFASRFHLLPHLPMFRRRAAVEPLPAPPLFLYPEFDRRVTGSRALKCVFHWLTYDLARVRDVDLGFVRRVAKRESFSPDVVFACPLSLRFLRLALAAARHFDIPMAVLNMDDWMAEEAERFGPVSHVWAGRIAKAMEELGQRAALRYTNSPRLAACVSERYSVSHDTLNNACEDLYPPDAPWAPAPPRENTVFLFSGALMWDLQGRTLVRVAEAISELATTLPVELHIYAPWEFAPIANQIQIPGKVVYKGFLARPELAAKFRAADFLVATTTFDDREILLFKHSLATKLSDYLCAGRPVVSVGHSDWALHEYVDTHACGVSVRTSERAAIKERLAEMIRMSRGEREAMGRRNRELWQRAHNVRVMARPLWEVLGIEAK